MNILIVLFYVCLVTLCGYHWTKILGYQSSLVRTSLGFLIGNGLVTYIWFIFYRLGLPFNLNSFGLSALLALSMGLSLSRVFPRIGINQEITKPFFVWEKVAIGIILFLGLTTICIAFYRPIAVWDALTMYDFRGKVIAATGTMADLIGTPYYTGYPFMTSLAHAAIYQFGGTNPQGIYPFFYLSLAGIVYVIIRGKTNRSTAFITSLLVMLSSDLWGHATFAYSNLPYTAYFVSAILLIAVSNKDNFSGNAFLSAILMGLSIWVRSAEPFWVVWLFILIGTSIYYKKIVFAITPVVIFFLLRYGWLSFQAQIFQAAPPGGPTLTELIFSPLTITSLLNNYSQVIEYLWKNLILSFGFIWLIIFAAIISTLSKIKSLKSIIPSLILVLTILLCSGLAIGGIVIFSTFFESWADIGDSARRMMMFITPLSVVLLALQRSQGKKS